MGCAGSEADAQDAAYADDIRFVFPGDSSWAGDFRGREEVERWVRRFLRAGLLLDPHETLETGPPWDTSVCVRYTDRATAPDGSAVYANRAKLVPGDPHSVGMERAEESLPSGSNFWSMSFHPASRYHRPGNPMKGEFMRGLVLQMGVSIDGFVAEPDGAHDWSHRGEDDATRARVVEATEGVTHLRFRIRQ